MQSDARVETDAVDNVACVKSLHFGVCVEFVEVAYAQGKICVCEEFDRLGLLHAHEQGGDVLLEGAFAEKCREFARGVFQPLCVGKLAYGLVLS